MAVWAFASSALADACTLESYVCTQRGNVWVEGVPIGGVCLEVALVENCEVETAINNCVALSSREVPAEPLQDGECRKTFEQCKVYVDGECVKTQMIFQCLNAPTEMGGAAFLHRRFENIEEVIERSNCEPIEAEPNCTLVETTEFGAFEGRYINHFYANREWWERELVFDCVPDDWEDTCASLEGSPICRKLETEVCLDEDTDGSCAYVEYDYQCESDASFSASCESVNVCVGDTCVGVEEEPSEDFPEAATWLNFLDQASKEIQCDASIVEPVEDFGPEYPNCQNKLEQIRQNIWGWDRETQEAFVQYYINDGTCPEGVTLESDPTANLCPEGQVALKVDGQTSCVEVGEDVPPEQLGEELCLQGYFDNGEKEAAVYAGRLVSCPVDILGAHCDAVQPYITAGSSHYLGKRCTSRVLGVCVGRRRFYCVYNSKFARVFQEQAHIQTGEQFKFGTEDPCPALTIEQLETLDVDAMDLTEVFGDRLDEVDEPVQDLVIDRLKRDMSVHTGGVQGEFE